MMVKLGQSRGRAQRVVALAAILRTEARSRDQIRARFGLYEPEGETSRKRFQRDLDDLRAAGVPVSEQDGVYRIAATHEPRFSQEELDALARLGGVVADPATGIALAQLMGGADAYPDVRASAWVAAALPEHPALMVEGRRVAFTYRDAEGRETTRDLEPWIRLCRRGLWYVCGWDHLRDAQRYFRIDRILGEVTDVGPAVVTPPEHPPRDIAPGDLGPVTMRLPTNAFAAAERMGATVVEELVGEVTMAFPGLRDESAIGFALRQGGVIIDPFELELERVRRRTLVAETHGGPAPDVPAVVAKPPGSRPTLSAQHLRRLLALPGWLSSREDVDVEEVARGFGCSVEDVHDDVELLADITLPSFGEVVDVMIDEEGLVHCNPSAIVPMEMSASDLAALRLLVETAETVLADGNRARLVPGLAALGKRLDTLHAPSVAHVIPTRPAVELLRPACGTSRVVTFDYERADGTKRRRQVVPLDLATSQGNVQLLAYDLDAGAGRCFRLDRMNAIIVTDEIVAVPDTPLPAPEWIPSEAAIDVVIRATPPGTWVFAMMRPESVHLDDDGRRWARIRTDAPDRLVEHVLASAGHAEIVSPPELRARLVDVT